MTRITKFCLLCFCFYLFALTSVVSPSRIVCLSIFPCANPILGDYKPFYRVTSELAHRGHEIEIILFEDYISWPEDLPNIHRRSAGKCPLTKEQEEKIFNKFTEKSYTDTVPDIIKYFQTYSSALVKHIWNDKEAIEKDLGGPIDAIIFGDVFLLGPAIADHFEVPFIRLHPGTIFDSELNALLGISIHPNQADTIAIDIPSITSIPIFQKMLNHIFSYLVPHEAAKETIQFENEFRTEMKMNLIPADNNYLYSSEKYSNQHSNLYPIAIIVANSPGFAQTSETPPFVHFVGPILHAPVPFQELPREKYPDIDDILLWLEDDSRPVILMSFSTVAHFSANGMEAIISGLSSLKESVRVLWVVREAARHSLPEEFTVPDNFLLTKFIPQFEVLGHEKVKLFFSVGGINSVLESIVQHTPVLCCGSHFEQNFNCGCVERLGVGVQLHKDYLTADAVRDSAVKLMNSSPEVHETLEDLTRLFLSSNSTRRAADVVEQSIHIGSNKYLLPRTVHTNWYERASLDVILAFVVLIVTFLWFLKFIFFCITIKCYKFLQPRKQKIQ